MTDVQLDLADAGAPVTRGRRTRRRWLAGGVVLLAALAVGGWWWWWLYSAQALQSGGAYETGATRPVGATFYSPAMVLPNRTRPLTLDVRSVSPRITQNTAEATITVLVCHRNGSISQLGSDDLSACSTTKAFRPGPLTIGTDTPGTNSLILAITTRQLGRVTIDGVQVSYWQGTRHGSQLTGGRITVSAVRTTPPPPPVTQPPTITALSPARGPMAGGTRIVIRGTNFTEECTVRFGTVTLTGKEVGPVSRRQLVVLAPQNVAGTVDIRVVTTFGVSPVVTADRFTYR